MFKEKGVSVLKGFQWLDRGLPALERLMSQLMSLDVYV